MKDERAAKAVNTMMTNINNATKTERIHLRKSNLWVNTLRCTEPKENYIESESLRQQEEHHTQPSEFLINAAENAYMPSNNNQQATTSQLQTIKWATSQFSCNMQNKNVL